LDEHSVGRLNNGVELDGALNVPGTVSRDIGKLPNSTWSALDQITRQGYSYRPEELV